MNINAMILPTTLRPNDTANDDRDIYLAICDALTKCTPLQPQLFHVKGHQDKDPKRPLTITEQLNVDCDRHAKVYAHSANKSSTAIGTPAILIAQPHLQIAG